MYLPKPTSITLSDAVKLETSCLDGDLVGMKFLDASPAGFADWSGWIKVESTAGNVADGVTNEKVMNGNGTTGANGLWFSGGITRAAGFFELWFKTVASNIGNAGSMHLFTSAAIANSLTNNACIYQGSNSQLNVTGNGGPNQAGVRAITIDKYNRIRMYVGKSADGATYKRQALTIYGEEFTTETLILDSTQVLTEFSATLYPSVCRTVNNATYKSYFKDPKWFSGYATDAPYVEYVWDAGAGKTFDNIDRTNFAMPGSVPSTNLTFSDSYDDGSASWSSTVTLANLNAAGKTTERHRYYRMRVYLNSDGATLVYASWPNASNASDGIGDFPSVENVLTLDTVQTVTGTATVPSASNVLAGTGTYGAGGTAITPTSDKLYSAAEEAARNSLNGSTAADILLGSSVKVLNVTVNGTAIEETHTADEVLKSAGGNWNDDNLQIGDEDNVKLDVAFGLSQTGTLSGGGGGNPPETPSGVSVTALTDTSGRVSFTWSKFAESVEVYTAATEAGSYTKIATVAATEHDITGLSVEQTVWVKVRAIATGETPSAYSTPISFTTLTSQSSSLIQRLYSDFCDMVQADGVIRDKIETFRTAKTVYNFEPSEYPLVLIYPVSKTEEFLTIAKRKVSTLIVGVSVLTYNQDTEAATEAVMSLCEKVQNACDKDLQLNGTAIRIDIGQAEYDFLDENVANANFQVTLQTQPFTAALR